MKKLYEVIPITAFGILLVLVYAMSGGETQTSDPITIGNITFVKIPEGFFMMGDDSPLASPNEQPVHRVRLNSFWMARTEITLAQWKTFLEDSKHPVGRSKGDGPTHPVVSITLEDARAFCKWFSRNYKVQMRLPSEAEWEYAARGGLAGKQYPNGDSISTKDANYGSREARPVAQYVPNGYGLYDMAGNVAEWTGDWYEKDYYKVSPSDNPRGPTTEKEKLQRPSDRGGGFCFGVEFVRVAHRHAGPGSWDMGGTADCLGFRPILEGAVQIK